MSRVLFDVEANGLLYNATKIWVLSLLYLDLNRIVTYTGDDISLGLVELGNADEIVGHNIIAYDLPLLYKIEGWSYTGLVKDTLIYSQLLNPDRKGGHSLEAWAKRLGMKPKTEVEQWDEYDPVMIERCERDCIINQRTLSALEREAYEEITGVRLNEPTTSLPD